MVKISQIIMGKITYTKEKQTTRVPKEILQTFQPTGKSDYTKITKEPKYATQINDLRMKYTNIEPEHYIAEAKNNGFRTLTITDEDYTNLGAKWDEIPA